MKLHRLENALDFESVEDRDAAIDLLIRSNSLLETDSIALQKMSPAPRLVVSLPDSVIELLESYSPPKPHFVPIGPGAPSDYRKDSLHLAQTYAAEALRQTLTTEWLDYWRTTFREIETEATNYLESGTDLEAVNRMLWMKVRGLVTQSGYDSFRMRARRYKASNTGKPLTRLQRFMWWLRGKRLAWKLIKKKVLYGAYDRYDTDPAHDPAKTIAIRCGYCGSEVQDDSIRPKLIKMLETQHFRLEKAEPLDIEVYNSLMRYEKATKCNDCQEPLQYAFICKVVRSVTAVLL